MPASTQPVQMPRIRRQELGNQLETHLQSLPGLPVITVFRGEVGDPPLKADKSKRVAPYVVLFDGTGPVDLEPAAGVECGEQLRWTPTFTVAAGFVEDCVDAIDRVYAWASGWRPVLPGVASGLLLPPPGFDPGSPRLDRAVSPPRWFVSLSWQLDLTT